MKQETIQTLHSRTNKKISLMKYELIKKEILAILSEVQPRNGELMEVLYQKVKIISMAVCFGMARGLSLTWR